MIGSNITVAEDHVSLILERKRTSLFLNVSVKPKEKELGAP